MTDRFRVAEVDAHPEVAERLLRGLPEWFGIEESLAEYVEDARRMRTVLASKQDGEPIGILLLNPHFPTSAEVHLMAVERAWHRRGVGSALVAEAERLARADGAGLLEVKTLGASRPDAGYDATRRFYLAMGFLPLEELLDLWPGNPCLILVKPLAA